MARHRRVTGRHRAPSTAGRTAARVTAGAAATVPLALGPPAHAEGMPASVRAAIVQCESGGRNIEHGGDPGGESTASGFYQFVNGTWRAFGGTEFAPRAIQASRAEQDTVADRAFAANGLRDWEASRSCWEGRIGRHASGQEAPQTGVAKHASYTVKHGDTLSSIAAAHGTSWQRLYAANRGVIENPHQIYPGEHLNVRGP